MECRRTTAGCQGDPKDTAQSLTPSWDSFTLAGALELRPGLGGLAAAAGRPGRTLLEITA